MKKLFFLIFITVLSIFLFKLYFHQKKEETQSNGYVNVINNPLIFWSKSWKREPFYTSSLGGSEFNFKFKNSQKLMFLFGTSSFQPIVGIEGWLDKEYFFFEYPSLTQDKTVLTIKPGEAKKEHTLKARIFCFVIPVQPCNFEVKSILLDSNAVLSKPTIDNYKILAILGDSISGVWGNQNYTFLLADKMNYHLINASYGESTLSKERAANSTFSGVLRVKTEIIPYQPDLVLIFLGTNDLGNHITLSGFLNDYEETIARLKKELPKTKIVAVGLLRRVDFSKEQIAEFSQTIKDAAARMDIFYINPYSWLDASDLADGLHPTKEAQRKMANDFFATLIKMKAL